jgi:DNA polymerase-3 subunit delta'
MMGAMSFSRVVGHEQAIEVLRRAIQTGRVPQAYLFVGPPNVGKTLVAKEFAKAINCEQLGEPAGPEQVDGCGRCHNCVRIEEENHADFRVIRPMTRLEAQEREKEAAAGASQEEEEEEGDEQVSATLEIEGSLIATDVIRRLIGAANFKKARETRRKVYVIKSADAMNLEAANRFLKTLEEPPGQTTFILTSARPSALPPTIVSRCQLIKFHPAMKSEAVQALLEEFPGADQDRVEAMVALSGGRYGRARALLQRPQALGLRAELLDMAAETAQAPLVQCLPFGERLMDLAEAWWKATEDSDLADRLLRRNRDRVLRTKMSELLDVLQTWYRDLALLGAGSHSELIINADRRAQLAELAPQYHSAGLSWASQVIEDIRRELAGNANLRLACEVLMLKLIAAKRKTG